MKIMPPCLNRSCIQAKNSCLIYAAFMKMMSLLIEVGLMKIMFCWNRSWIDDCPSPRFLLVYYYYNYYPFSYHRWVKRI